jgi:hypothetical protein
MTKRLECPYCGSTQFTRTPVGEFSEGKFVEMSANLTCTMNHTFPETHLKVVELPDAPQETELIETVKEDKKSK